METSFETGATPEHRLRYNANEMFSGEVGQTFWRNSRDSRLSTSANRREQRFHQILDEEYQRVVRVQKAGGSGMTTLTRGESAIRNRRPPNSMVRRRWHHHHDRVLGSA